MDDFDLFFYLLFRKLSHSAIAMDAPPNDQPSSIGNMTPVI